MDVPTVSVPGGRLEPRGSVGRTPLRAAVDGSQTGGVTKCHGPPPRSAGRLCSLRTRLDDERSGRVVFVSHCLLNENTRYLGGAFRPGVVSEVVGTYIEDGTGICQMPCPEQLVWGGVLKRRLLALTGRVRLRPLIRALRPGFIAYTWLRYLLLARTVAKQIADYQRSGFEVLGVVGVDASPTCGTAITLDIDTSLDAMVSCRLDQLDRAFMNESIIEGSAVPGRGLFITRLGASLAHRGCEVPLFGHDLRSEAPGSTLPTGPAPCGMVGDHRRPRPCCRL